jgi:hypothetical protein
MSDQEEEVTALAVREPLDIFQHFDHLDDEAIVNELEGRLVESAVYHFNQQGKELWGLGKTGVDWCATELAKKGYIIRDEDLTYATDPTDSNFILFTAKVGKYFVDKGGMEAKVDAAIGTKRQGIKIERRDGSRVPDPFWFEKGSQKAIRNARMRLIPEETKAAIITAAKGGGKVREVRREELEVGRGPQAGRAPERANATPSPAPAHSTAFTDKMKAFEGAKKYIGNEAYYTILGTHGVEHANEIKTMREMDAALAEMRKFAQERGAVPPVDQ